jgi:CO/xanthine dehydrogenase Mo-binding subunit
VLNVDNDAGPPCLGSFAARVTHISGNAVISAARRDRGFLFDLAAKELEASAPDLLAAEGKIHLIGLSENL